MQFHRSKAGGHFATAVKSGMRALGNSWHLQASVQPLPYSYVTRSLADWHMILGHVNTRTILNMVNQRLVQGTDIAKKSSRNPKIDCIGCTMGKATVRPFKKSDKSEFPTEVGAVVYSDTWGPARTPSIQGQEYMISFTDGSTRYTLIFFMKNKNEAFQKYKNMEAWFQTQLSKPIKRFHYDGGKELIHKEFQAHCASKGTAVTT